MSDAKSPMMMRKSMHRTTLDGPMQGAKRRKVPIKPTAEKPMIISASELGSFLRCRLQWNWGYRVGIQSRKFSQPQAIGIIVHDGRDHWYRERKRTVKGMARIADRIIGEIKFPIERKDRDLARAMLVGYAAWAKGTHDKSDRAIGKRRVRPEFEFCLPLFEDGSVLIRGKIDDMFRPTIYKNTLAMDEMKTKNGIDFDMLDLNVQMTTYLWAMSVQFPQFERYQAYRTIGRRQMPGPRVKAPLFGRSDAIERDPADLRLWLKDTRNIVRDMMDAAIYPTATDRCKWDCDFYRLCLVRSDKADLEDLITAEYNRK